MPKFGDYETLEEPLRVTEGGEYSTVVWKARRTLGPEGEFYVVKQFILGHWPGKGVETGSGQESNGQGRLKDFVVGVKQLEKSRAQDGRGLARVYASGSSSTSAWYVTDFYARRSLKEFINLQGGVESQALRQVVYWVVLGCLELRQATGRSHGNLKPGNILLAGKPQQLRKTQLHLVDPLPLRREVRAGKPGPPTTGDQALNAQTEAADLRAIGELIVQLVEGRIIQSAYDYNYPVAASAAWDRLGKEAGLWLKRCNQLLNPQLNLENLNLQTLEKELRWVTSRAAIAQVAGAVAVVLVVTGLWYGVGSWRDRLKATGRIPPQSKNWQDWMDFVRGAEGRGEWPLARDTLLREMLPRARALKDPSLEQQAQGELSFAAAMSDAEETWHAGKLDLASRGVEKALQQRPDQPAALALKGQIAAALDELAKVRELTQLMQSVQKAESDSQWSQALALLAKAVSQAAPLSDSKYNQSVNTELKYAQHMDKAQSALNQGRYEEARQQAAAALVVKDRDGPATQILAAARTEEKYQASLKDAQDAVDKKRYAEALRQVQAALLIKPAGTEAAQLGGRVQDQAFEGARLAFDQGEYRGALEQCRGFEGIAGFDKLRRDIGQEQDQLHSLEQALDQGRYETILGGGLPAKPAFERLKAAAVEESQSLEQAQRKQASGDYSYIEKLEQVRYRTKPPFVALLEAGRRGRASVAKRPAPVTPKAVEPPVDAPKPVLTSSPRRLEENDQLLDYWQFLFGLKPPPADREIKREDPTKDGAYRLEQLDRLEAEYGAAGALDSQRKQRLNTLRWLVSRGRLGEQPPAR